MTRSRVNWWQVAEIQWLMLAPLDQESPGSSPGGAMKPGNDFGRAGLRLSAGYVRYCSPMGRRRVIAVCA